MSALGCRDDSSEAMDLYFTDESVKPIRDCSMQLEVMLLFHLMLSLVH